MASDSASRIYEEASAYLRDLIRQHLDCARTLRLELAGEMDAMDVTLSLLERLPAQSPGTTSTPSRTPAELEAVLAGSEA